MNTSKKISIISLGCPKNTVDSEILKGGLLEKGFIYSDDPADADTVVINTCGFIEEAREESVDTILNMLDLKNNNSIRRVLVAGCMSERYKIEMERSLPEVDAIYGVNAQHEILAYLLNEKVSSCESLYPRSLMTPSHYAYLKIAEGCDNQCSFCSIPLMRGTQKSVEVDKILSEAEYLHQIGVRELILIAQDLTRYGTDLDTGVRLPDLLNELLSLQLFPWVRLLYNNPDHWNMRVNELFVKFPALCPYIDLPIQHASDRILKKMNRGKNQKQIREIVRSIRGEIPNVAIRTSVLVGFPGETDEDFDILQDFIEEMRFERLGVFTYSEEEGTTAAQLSDNIPQDEKEYRKDIIMRLQYDISNEYAISKIDEKISVIIDRSENDNFIGRSVWDAPDIDCTVKIISDKSHEVGDICKASVIGTQDFDLICKN